MSNEEAAPETKGVTAELLTTVDLGPEIEGMAGRQLRMRMFTFEPGAVFGPIHDHKDRPGVVYILQGTITDHRNGVATDYGPGVGWPEEGTPPTGLRTEERFRRWRSRSISSGLPNSSSVREGLGRDPTPITRCRIGGTLRHNGNSPRKPTSDLRPAVAADAAKSPAGVPQPLRPMNARSCVCGPTPAGTRMSSPNIPLARTMSA